MWHWEDVLYNITENSFNPPTSGLRDKHACAGPICSPEGEERERESTASVNWTVWNSYHRREYSYTTCNHFIVITESGSYRRRERGWEEGTKFREWKAEDKMNNRAGQYTKGRAHEWERDGCGLWEREMWNTERDHYNVPILRQILSSNFKKSTLICHET